MTPLRIGAGVLACAMAVGGAIASATGCVPTIRTLRMSGEGVDPTSLPPEHREEYALFAQRCSKCHSLSRALDNGHIEDRFWERYVDRMRHQPGSGIAPEDVPPILRFLHYYSEEVGREGGAGAGGTGTSASPASPASSSPASSSPASGGKETP